jgi:sec-independent protein translocase protein TatA
MELFGSGGIVVLLVVVILFGSKKLPEMARSLGRAQGEFKKGIQEGNVEDSAGRTSSDAPTSGEDS